MMFMLTTLCLFFLALVRAIPLESRDVINPQIMSPDASTVWVVGQTETVSWNTTNLPPDSQITNKLVTVILGFLESGDDSEHLMLDNPLAKDIPIRAGQVNITVPSVTPRNSYIVVVMGDSGNVSPQFTINAGQSLPASSGSSSSSASSNSASSSASGSSSRSSSSSSLITAPIPISGTVITGNPSSVPSVTSSGSVSAASPTATTPTTSGSSSVSRPSLGSSSSSASAESASQTDTNSAAWGMSFNYPCSFILAAVIIFLQV
ncbi:hypothetical protein D9758_014456 [Tetrapyrgos nigripes]|uniref:Uncharacterized protein n=1 Tax=Tetrapyrgos nigripes TaxID=182062 RepID=A0A8H5BVD2_9AGAR|nr:hypothetical protein D9758_014456 [Tetrapyrgos nigripes]